MTETQPSVSSVAIKYGFIGALASVVYSAILLITGLATNGWLSSLGYVILIVAIIMAIKEYKKLNYGYLSFGQGLGLGTLISAIFGLFTGLFMFVYTSFIDPNYQADIMDKQRIELEEKGMSDEQIDQAISIGESVSSPMMMIVLSLVGYIFVGFIISLIISAIMKNARPEFE